MKNGSKGAMEDRDITWFVESVADDVTGLSASPPEGMKFLDPVRSFAHLYFDIVRGSGKNPAFTCRVVGDLGSGPTLHVVFDTRDEDGGLAACVIVREGTIPVFVRSPHQFDVAHAILFGALPKRRRSGQHRRTAG